MQVKVRAIADQKIGLGAVQIPCRDSGARCRTAPSVRGFSPEREDTADRAEKEKHEETGRRHGTVLAEQLAEPVHDARRSCEHGLVPQMAANVLSQFRGGAVAQGTVLRHRLHHDPVQITAKLLAECLLPKP